MNIKSIYAIACISIVLFLSLSAGMVFFLTHVPWVNISLLEQHSLGNPSIVLDDEGNELARFSIDRREPVAMAQIPKYVIDAFVTAEDRSFFSHTGLSLKGIARSLIVNIFRRKTIQGASTITQQLARLVYFDHQKTFKRKIKEQILALAIEGQLSKDTILEAYLNNLYFGCGIYGIQAACQRFWSKSVTDISIGQAATLAAIIPAPSRYCPLINPNAAMARRNYILATMHNLGLISKSEYQRAQEQPITVNVQKNTALAPHVRQHIQSFIENELHENVYTAGLVIQTTINTAMQQRAEKIFKKHVTQLRADLKLDIDGALVSIDSKTGEIKTLIGGYDFNKSQFNRAYHAQRQIGSIFKPILYVAAIEAGFDFDHIQIDEPITSQTHNQPWQPQNYNKKFDGPLTLAHALITSKNTIPVKLINHLGIQTIINYAKRFHISKRIAPYPSMVLGTVTQTPVEVTGIFNIFTNRGVFIQPHVISWIKNAHGHKIWKQSIHSEQVIPWQTSSKVAHVLALNYDNNRLLNPEFPAIPVCGKSGTTNKCRTCWFAGSTPRYTTVVYIGKDDNQSLGSNIFPRTTAFPIWLEFMKFYVDDKEHFDYEPTLHPFYIHSRTGRPAAESNPQTISILKE